MNVTINRTKLELKHWLGGSATGSLKPINRTKLELKQLCCSVMATIHHLSIEPNWN